MDLLQRLGAITTNDAVSLASAIMLQKELKTYYGDIQSGRMIIPDDGKIRLVTLIPGIRVDTSNEADQEKLIAGFKNFLAGQTDGSALGILYQLLIRLIVYQTLDLNKYDLAIIDLLTRSDVSQSHIFSILMINNIFDLRLYCTSFIKNIWLYQQLERLKKLSALHKIYKNFS